MSRSNGWVYMMIGVLVLGCFALAGCGDETVAVEQPSALEDAAVSPTFTEIQAVVGFDESQSALVKEKLDDWRRTSAQTRPRDRRRGGNATGECGGPPPAGVTFLAEVAPALSSTQVLKTATYLAEWRSSRQAQRKDRRGERPPRPEAAGECMQDLGLTEDQRDALQAAREEMRAERHALRDQFRDGAITEDELHAAMEQLRETFRNTMEGILTEDQLAQADSCRTERILAGLEKRLECLGSRVESRLAHLTAILDLTDDQQADVRALLETAVEDAKAIIQAMIDGTTPLDDGRDALRTLAQETRDAIRALLTEEQAEIFDALKPLRSMGPRHR